MILLSVSASTQRASLALGSPGGPVAELANETPQTHSEFLNSGLGKLLETTGKSLRDVDAIAIDIGPGSFTGVRAAVNLGRTLGYALKKPLIQRTSLELVAHGLSQDSVAAINAHKNLMFTRWADGSIELLSLPDFSAKVLAHAKPLAAVGDAFIQYGSHLPTEVQRLLVRRNDVSDFPAAKTFFEIDPQSAETFDWKSVRPLYVRASSAEEVLSEKITKGNSDGTSGLGRRRG